jgi:hypothetical protein
LPVGTKKFRQSPLHEKTPEELRARAEQTAARKEQHKIDAPMAMKEYREAEQALRDRTSKLRGERLAREANEEPSPKKKR